MPAPRLTVVLSQGQSQHPAKRNLEEEIAATLLVEPGIDVSIVPHLYDLTDDHTGTLFLRSVRGDMVVLSWLYPRAAYWELDRAGVKGHEGTVLLKKDEDTDEETDDEDEHGNGSSEAEPKVTLGAIDVPDRKIYCLDLRDFDSADPYVSEIRRIAAETRVQTVSLDLTGLAAKPSHEAAPAAGDLMNWIQGAPRAEQLARFLDPTPRRWHPVIDYSRCTNCMECIDFCLFGVYGVDGAERILVEQPDSCKKGCPACSRVCPEHAIIFPMHKTPEIAGAPGESLGGLKIDLSKLFGGPDAFEIAALERDVELVRDGREAVGMSVGIPKRQEHRSTAPKDDLDKLVDDLDALAL